MTDEVVVQQVHGSEAEKNRSSAQGGEDDQGAVGLEISGPNIDKKDTRVADFMLQERADEKPLVVVLDEVHGLLPGLSQGVNQLSLKKKEGDKNRHTKKLHLIQAFLFTLQKKLWFTAKLSE